MRRLPAVAALLALLPALAAAQASPYAASAYRGRSCAPDGAVCATLTGTPNAQQGVTFDVAVTFQRAGLLYFASGAALGVAGSADDFGAFQCCADPDGTLDLSFGNLLPIGRTVTFPVWAWVVPVGDPRTAADLAAEIQPTYPAFDPSALGLRVALATVSASVVAVPEPAPAALLAAGLAGLLALAAGASRRRAA